jgi:F420 biosynthesis protein FbiB-like protein
MNKENQTSNETALAEHIDARRSVRRYHPSAISADVVERLLAAASRAPSAHNRQPWRFAALNDIETKHALATAMAGKLRQDRSVDGDAPEIIEADIARSYQRITQAPLVIVVFVDMTEMDRYPDDARNDAEYLMAVQSTAMAAQNLLLAAQAEGLGASIMCAPLFCPDVVAKTLSLSNNWRAQMLLTIGAPVAPGRDRPRKPLDQIARRFLQDDPSCK